MISRMMMMVMKEQKEKCERLEKEDGIIKTTETKNEEEEFVSAEIAWLTKQTQRAKDGKERERIEEHSTNEITKEDERKSRFPIAQEQLVENRERARGLCRETKKKEKKKGREKQEVKMKQRKQKMEERKQQPEGRGGHSAQRRAQEDSGGDQDRLDHSHTISA